MMIAAVVLTTTVVSFGETRSAEAQTCASSSSVESAEVQAERQFVSQLNSMRSSRGLRSLAVNTSIATGSDQWSAVMARDNWLRHDPNLLSLLGSVISNLLGWGENVGYSSISFCSTTQLTAAVASVVDSLHHSFARSTGHLLNMINPAFNQVGIGVEISGSRLWVTVRFANGTLPPPPVAISAATRRYLDAVHQLFLRRLSSTSDDERWGPLVEAGNRAAVTQSLSASEEWAGVEIRNLYRKILGRDADRTGFEYWLGQVRAGHTIETMAAYFYGGAEYFHRAGRTNRGFVSRLYGDLLGRSPDSRGLNYWVSMLDSGRLTRTRVAEEFYAGIESRTQRVTRLYRIILGRSPDRSGLAYWAEQLRSIGDITLAQYLAASDEYFRRHS